MARRRDRGAHQSVSVNSLEMLDEEVKGFTSSLDILRNATRQLGTPEDSQALRNNIQEAKQRLSIAETSISNRLKNCEVSDEEYEKFAQIQEDFFESKSLYFSILRECQQKEAVSLPTPAPVSNPYPNIQRFGNPHTSPALQIQLNKPPPLPNRDNDEQQPVGPPVNRNNYPSPSSSFVNEPQPYYSPEPQYSNAVQMEVEEWGGQQFQQQQQQQMQQQLVQEQEQAPVAMFDEDGNITINGIQLNARDSIYWDAKEVVERNEEINFIASEMAIVAEAFVDIAQEVDVQADQIEQAETQAVQATVNAKTGVTTMGKTAKNAKKVIMPGIGGSIGGVTGAVAGGLIGGLAMGMVVPGMVVGTAIGVGAGGAVGHAAGVVLRKNADKDMHKARLNENWQPDSTTKNCSGCNRKFTQVVRRHHCRSCGVIFCGRCTKHKMYIPGVDSDSRPRVCNPCFEALMYHQQGVRPPNWKERLEKAQAALPAPEYDPEVPPPPPPRPTGVGY